MKVGRTREGRFLGLAVVTLKDMSRYELLENALGIAEGLDPGVCE